MANNSTVLKAIHTTTKETQAAAAAEDHSALTELMTDADYLRQSSALINEALQKGFDVLQLANGDIVTTGTKTIVNTYSWDQQKNKLIKAKAAENKARAKKDEFIEEMLDD